MNSPSDNIERRAQCIFSDRAAYYATSAPHDDPEVLAWLVDLARPEAHWRVLDVATGAGHTAFALAPRVRHVVATDLTAAMIVQARRLAETRQVQNVAFGLADAHHLPFSDRAFDLLTSRLAPHHFARIHNALHEFRRVLKSRGRLVINDRSVPEDDFVDTCMNRLDWYHDESHVRQYRPGEWRAMLESGGFQVDVLELYTRSRPLASLTDNVEPERVAAIEDILQGLTPEEHKKLGYEKRGDTRYINHWYVMIGATCRP